MSTAKPSRPTSSESTAAPRIEGDKILLAANGNGRQAERREGLVCRARHPLPPGRAEAKVVRERTEDYRGLTERLAQVQYHRGDRSVPWDELLSAAHLGLLEAASHFDEKKGVPLGAYVTMIVRQRLRRAVQRWHRRREGQVCFSELDGPDRAANPAVVDPAVRRTPEPDRAAAVREALARVRQVLPERWFSLLWMHYVQERTLGEIGREVGVSRQRVQQLLDKAVKQVRHLCRGDCDLW